MSDRLIDSMCLTWRHDFGLTKTDALSSGIADGEREQLRRQMQQLLTHHGHEIAARFTAAQPPAQASRFEHAGDQRTNADGSVSTLVDDDGSLGTLTTGIPSPGRILFNPTAACVPIPPAQAEPSTPAAKWREDGEPDPHGKEYDCERAQLAKGHLTDDELANALFICDHRTSLESIGYLTAAKDRIRWLSRRLCAQPEPSPDSEQPERHWRQLASDLYQACGAYDMPVRVLDALSAASRGEPFQHLLHGLLPCTRPTDTEQQRRDAEAFMQGDRVRAACDLYEDGSDLPPFLYAKAGDLLIVRGVHAGERCYSVAHEGVDDSWFQVSPSELVGAAIEAEGKAGDLHQ